MMKEKEGKCDESGLFNEWIIFYFLIDHLSRDSIDWDVDKDENERTERWGCKDKEREEESDKGWKWKKIIEH